MPSAEVIDSVSIPMAEALPRKSPIPQSSGLLCVILVLQGASQQYFGK